MCGLAGTFSKNQGVDLDVLQHMRTALTHRGPDEGRVWHEKNFGAAFQRLAIQDISQNGSQPMHSANGRYVIVYNGEIYNLPELKALLPTQNWRGHSDTEVILAGFQHMGIEGFLPHLNGMFALALYDRHEEKLYLARDRMGIKPLYYANLPHCFIFASELKALETHPACPKSLNFDGLHSYLRLACFPAPMTIYEGVYKLRQGELLIFSAQGLVSKFYAPQKKNTFEGTYQEAVVQLELLLKEAISRQMVSDVPLGAFLSGGIDSSSVVALMQAQSSQAIQTFTLGFHTKDYDEAGYAKAIAHHLNTQHTELYVNEQDALAILPRLIDIYDEPFADSSAIPTFLVSQLAKQNVTVALSGDGGDELFAGYRRYVSYEAGLKHLFKLPLFMREPFAKLLETALASPLLKDKLNKAARVLKSGKEDYYLSLLSQIQNPSQFLVRGTETPLAFEKHADFIHQMQTSDLKHYLPDDILTKLDRASMSVSLETRVPLLDNKIVDFALSLPTQFLIQNNKGKMPLRDVLYKYVPKNLIERPKAGFALPLAQWLRGELKPMMMDYLSPATLKRQGILEPKQVELLLHTHLNGTQNNAAQLWVLVMLQAFLHKKGF